VGDDSREGVCQAERGVRVGARSSRLIASRPTFRPSA
jgi:hypothetical protein